MKNLLLKVNRAFWFRYFDKIFALTLLSLGVFIKWEAGLFTGDFGVLSVVSTLSTVVLVGIILLSKPPEKIQINLSSIITCTFAILPSFWSVQYASENEPLTVMTAVASMIAYKVFLIVCYLYLGKNFGFLPAFRGVTSKGPYQLLRHPIYSSYIHMQFIIFVLMLSPIQFAFVAIMVVTSLIRIRQEELILCQSPLYVAYKNKVKDALFRPVVALPALLIVVFKISFEVF